MDGGESPRRAEGKRTPGRGPVAIHEGHQVSTLRHRFQGRHVSVLLRAHREMRLRRCEPPRQPLSRRAQLEQGHRPWCPVDPARLDKTVRGVSSNLDFLDTRHVGV